MKPNLYIKKIENTEWILICIGLKRANLHGHGVL